MKKNRLAFCSEYAPNICRQETKYLKNYLLWTDLQHVLSASPGERARKPYWFGGDGDASFYFSESIF
jgi:hypothetical protein